MKAGRPPSGNIQISIRLPRKVLEKLTVLADERFCTKSQLIARLIMTAPKDKGAL